MPVIDVGRAWEPIMEVSLARENRVVLDVVQAALGLISREIRAISVHADQGRILLYIAVHERSAQALEDIDDLAFELEALQDRATEIETSVHVGEPGTAWPGHLGRLVYVAKEP